MTEEHKTMFILTLLAIALVYIFRKIKASEDGIRGLLPGAAKKNQRNIERNGTQNEFLLFIRKLLKAANKNKWYMLLPGTLAQDELQTMLNGIIITQYGIIGFKSYGFGGKISKKNGTWSQTLNGKKNDIANIEDERQRQQTVLHSILDKNGLGDLPLKVVSIFTTPGVYFENITSNHYLTSETALSYLETETFQSDASIVPKEIGKKLEELKYKPS